MRAIQTVGVVMGREWSHLEAVVFKICSLSLSAAIIRWKSGKPAFAVEVYFSNRFSVIATSCLSKLDSSENKIRETKFGSKISWLSNHVQNSLLGG
jgi:hypothetical protein